MKRSAKRGVAFAIEIGWGCLRCQKPGHETSEIGGGPDCLGCVQPASRAGPLIGRQVASWWRETR